jgi:hypothetical protein
MKKLDKPQLTSSKHQDWRSPGYLLELAKKVHPIAFDPATAVSNPTGAAVYATRRGVWIGRRHLKGCSGLSVDWRWCLSQGRRLVGRGGGIYINPQYGAWLAQWAKLMTEHASTRGFRQLAVVAARPDTAVFKQLWHSASLCLFWGSPTLGSRIKFTRPGSTDSATFPSAVFYWGDDQRTFRSVFEEHGLLIPTHHGRLPTAIRSQLLESASSLT